MSANERQVGGDHYKGAAMEHWDFVIKGGLGYLRGCASKYVYRWKDKGGLSDLKKAGHYIEKLLEISETDDREKFKYGAAKAAEVTGQFIQSNGIPSDEATILSYLASDWDLGLADSHLKMFIAKLEDEGHQEKPSDGATLKALESAKETIAAMQATADESALFVAKLNKDAADMSDRMAEMAATLTQVQADYANLKSQVEEPAGEDVPKNTDPAAPAGESLGDKIVKAEAAAHAKPGHAKKR